MVHFRSCLPLFLHQKKSHLNSYDVLFILFTGSKNLVKVFLPAHLRLVLVISNLIARHTLFKGIYSEFYDWNVIVVAFQYSLHFQKAIFKFQPRAFFLPAPIRLQLYVHFLFEFFCIRDKYNLGSYIAFKIFTS